MAIGTMPLHPAEIRSAIGNGTVTAGAAIRELCEATANALARSPRRPLLAHLFSVLPKVGLTEDMVPAALLAHLANRVARAGAMVEVNEKWGCPGTASIAAAHAAGVRLVASTDSHVAGDVGRYQRVAELLRKEA